MAKFKIRLLQTTYSDAIIELDGESPAEIIAAWYAGGLESLDLSNIEWNDVDSDIEMVLP